MDVGATFIGVPHRASARVYLIRFSVRISPKLHSADLIALSASHQGGILPTFR